MVKRFSLSRAGMPLGQRINGMVGKYVKHTGILLVLGLIGVFLQLHFSQDDHLGYPGRALLDTKQCNGDTILPLIPYENTWPLRDRAILYLLFLAWLFLGVAISADCFMAAIEVITSKTEEIEVEGKTIEVDVWNATVANLTLMALGSSAPEILLAVVEICSLKFEAGDLGPGTIVGSAAFNLLFITSICISSLPFVKDEHGKEDESMTELRRIDEFGVFVITAIASLFAYLWMVIVLEWWTKDQVTLLEAFLTLLMFPALVWVSWAEDQSWWGYFGAKVEPEEEDEEHADDKQHLTAIKGPDGDKIKVRRASHSIAEEVADLDPETAKAKAAELAAAAYKKKKKSRLEYRIQATRKMTGAKRILPTHHKKHSDIEEEDHTESTGPPVMRVGFEKSKTSCKESCDTHTIKIIRSGITDKPAKVRFDTSDGVKEDNGAIAGEDYVSASGPVEFAAGETEKEISITVIDDNEWAPDKHFYVRLFADGDDQDLHLSVATCEVIILNDDFPGTLSFTAKTVAARNTKDSVTLTIERKDGEDGNVLVFLKCIDGTAKAGVDYHALEGEAEEVAFAHEEREKTIDIPLIVNPDKTDISFTVEFAAIEPEGAKAGAITKCTVIITDDKNYQKLVEEVMQLMDEEIDQWGVETSSWGEQFHNAMNMGSDEGEPEWSDYLLHFLSFYWKVFHAFVPPTDYFGGWGTFWVSLGTIGFITCFVGDTAKMLGCVIGLEDSITAITFVALGTSLPDTFASMSATVEDETADAAITNVTGSNSVNVFLGLGLPWVMASIYHAAKDTPGGFNYPAGDLNFSVLVFFAFAVVCIGLLVFRRYVYGGELGGPTMAAYAHSGFLALSWCMYVVISYLKTAGKL